MLQIELEGGGGIGENLHLLKKKKSDDNLICFVTAAKMSIHNLQRNGLNEIELGNRTEYDKNSVQCSLYSAKLKQSSRQGALCCRIVTQCK